MLQIQFLQRETATALARLAKRGADFSSLVEEILAEDQRRRESLAQLERLRAEANKIAKSAGTAIAKGDVAAADRARNQSAELKTAVARLEQSVAEIETRLHDLLVRLPNAPHESVPPGRGAEDNVVVHERRRETHPDAEPKPHWEIVSDLGTVDFERGAKISGSGFPVYVGAGARLQRALIQFFLDRAQNAGYLEIHAPHLVNSDTAFGTGQLPDKEGQMYFVCADDLYLIPTAEVPITNLYRDEIIAEERLPVKLCGYTPCFRREAGSYGKDVRGLNRLHQFDKVEIVQIVKPETAYDALEEMTRYAESLLDELELSYRRVLLCGGDMGFASAKTYDLEVWSAGQSRWLEVSSVSCFEAFQANRMKLRYRPSGGGKPQPLYTLNGSALALPRVVAALLENHRRKDGTVRLPACLHEFFGAAQLTSGGATL
ncbi:MAG: serine--tRNA ligase [Bacteroidia bacterium]|nr:serine--tRNA ligase [Bacteroidia bacterium]MDW8333037.1 serine--tRNA ligase [Bacteroidia bacterium]